MIYGLTVARNESHRYLDAFLVHTADVVDAHFLYDDQSTDDTAGTARQHGCVVETRPDGVASFLEHEAEFRTAAWLAFQAAFYPTVHDWVLAVDCDEFLVAPGPDVRFALHEVLRVADSEEAIAVQLAVPEVFGWQDGQPLVRRDGWWGREPQPRLFRYRDGAVFRPKPMGCGSAPLYVHVGRNLRRQELYLLHLGYAADADRRERHQRYEALGKRLGREAGHLRRHIDSIPARGRLEPWDGPPLPSLVTAGQHDR